MTASPDLSRTAIIDAVTAYRSSRGPDAESDVYSHTGAAAAGGTGDIDWGGTVNSSGLVPAAVLVPLVMRSAGATVLLTRRTEHLRHHPGQISFPGGHIEDGDRDAVAAALREAEEEIGLIADDIEIVGAMDHYQTGTGFEVTPIVGLVAEHYGWRLDPTEVEEIFEVPMSFVMDPANHHRETRIIRGRPRRYFVLPYKGRHIWGATAGILINLYRVLSTRR